MSRIELFGIRSSKIVSWGDDVEAIFSESIEKEGLKLQNKDILAITSKIFSMQYENAVLLNDVKPSDRAILLGNASKLDPRIAQLVLDESNDQVYGSVYKAILAKTDYGLLANAGIDQSNCPKGYVLLLPKNPDEIAVKFRNYIKNKYELDIAILIIDSRTIPLKKGTTAVSIGVAGIEPIIDEIGKKDLYGYEMTITTRALADNVATSINLLMGETDEQTPFGIIRGLEYTASDDVSTKSTLIPEKYCLYFGPLIKLIDETF